MREEIRKMEEKLKRPQKVVLFASAGVGGGTAIGFALATDLSPMLTGLLSALLGAATFVVALRLLGEKPYEY